MLTESEKKYLLNIARVSILEELRQEPASVPPPPPCDSHGLDRQLGAFVTLFDRGELRGCLGVLKTGKPIPATIAEMARRAATDDPRFDPVTLLEIDALTIEVSILSPFTRIDDPSAISIGRDGLLIEHGRQRGLLLPQVAEKYRFTPLEFLEETCVKAGLPREAWKLEGTVLSTFTAEVFGEE